MTELCCQCNAALLACSLHCSRTIIIQYDRQVRYISEMMHSRARSNTLRDGLALVYTLIGLLKFICAGFQFKVEEVSCQFSQKKVSNGKTGTDSRKMTTEDHKQ